MVFILAPNHLIILINLVNRSYLKNINKKHFTNLQKIVNNPIPPRNTIVSSDKAINKLSNKDNSNKKDILNSDKTIKTNEEKKPIVFANKTFKDILTINKIVYNFVKNNKIKELFELLKIYNVNVKMIETLIKIDKSLEPIKLASKSKKIINGLIKTHNLGIE